MTGGRFGKLCTPVLAALGCAGLTPAQAAPDVVVSISPIHSLVAGVMQGVAEPRLLLTGGASPHAYSLRPSDAAALDGAELVFWVGEGMEAFLEKPLGALSGDARLVEIADIEGIELLALREGGVWEPHEDHEGDEHEAAEGEAHGLAAEEQHEAAEATEHADETHEHGEHDMHLWLDPHNAELVVRTAAAVLSEADPAGAPRYQANAEALVERLEALAGELEGQLAAVRDRPYLVFHDAYQYFERHFGLSPAGTITLDPERKPGARRLQELRDKVVELGAVCVFREPQFEPALVDTLIDGTNARTGVLDPLGADIPPGPEAYFTLVRGLADSLADCLLPAS